ncbi:MAG TPA: hypothetical protein VGL14_03430, partial [Methylomirabilota bacterium]
KQPAAPAVVDSRPRRARESRAAERPVTRESRTAEPPTPQESPRNEMGDGSAIIDWLLKDRR